MNISSLPYSLDITSSTGSTLSTEETYVLQNSLRLLQHENHLTKIYFWGKIFGVERDYYVAFGYSEHVEKGRIFYYSLNLKDWTVLNGPTLISLKLLPKVSDRFLGQPNYIFDCNRAVSLEPGDSNRTDLLPPGSEYHLKEEDRLAAVVNTIYEDCAIAPKRAFKMSSAEVNPIFQGLSLEEGCDLQSWMHITEVKDHHWQASSMRNIGEGSCDSKKGLIQGRWNISIRAQGSVCVMRSLTWLGFTAYHRIRTPDHGFVYFGDGIKASAQYGLTEENAEDTGIRNESRA